MLRIWSSSSLRRRSPSASSRRSTSQRCSPAWLSPHLRDSAALVRSEGLEERRERPDDPKNDQRRSCDQDRPQRRILPPPQGMENAPRREVGDHGEDRLPRQRTHVVAELEEVVDTGASLAEGREQPEHEGADAGGEQGRGDGTCRPIDLGERLWVNGFAHVIGAVFVINAPKRPAIAAVVKAPTNTTRTRVRAVRFRAS